AFLREQCGEDTALQAEVTGLLRADAEGNSLLERDVAHVAHEVLNDSSTASTLEQFGRYHIKRTLGAGGMGIVYLGEREDLRSLRGGGLCAPARCNSSRPETLEHSCEGRWDRPLAGFRNRQANGSPRRGRRTDDDRPALDDAGVRLAGTNARRTSRHPDRRLF